MRQVRSQASSSWAAAVTPVPMKPIHDEVLRRAVQAMVDGDKISLLTEAGHETILVKQVFSELLALREAAKKSVDAYHGCCECCGGDVTSSDEAMCALRALLPEESGL